jgi:hypothetical protein
LRRWRRLYASRKPKIEIAPCKINISLKSAIVEKAFIYEKSPDGT